ncbi:MAG: PrsW family intramembrane metalloprotease [Eubacterium sp.]|nr:PrsW family intramembrane metalloprotease [Eubacterium sp.]
MDNMIYILFICIMVPLLMMLPLLKGQSRLLLGYMMVGIFACLFAAEVNGLIRYSIDRDIYYITTNITPVTEEIIKALPILYFAFIFSDDKEKLIPMSFAVGVGFAVLENMVILTQNIENVSIFWALIRGFASGLMHGICTSCVGYGTTFVRKKRKLFICGTFALLAMAITYHASFNILVQSAQYKYLGFVLPLITYVPVVLFLFSGKKILFKKEAEA